uniref:Uncharacterized protein n=1 Tax=Oscillatoriales cyanobacterium SpSt-402 TaxID=2282168 RepID=A0A832M611_9CYAN
MANEPGFVVDPLVIPTYIPRLNAFPPPQPGIFADPKICIPLNVKWVAFVAGILEVLMQPDLWQGNAETIAWAQQQVIMLQNAMFTGEPECVTIAPPETCEDGCVEYLPNTGLLNFEPNDPYGNQAADPPPGYLINPWYSNPTIPPIGVIPTDAMVNTLAVAFENWGDIISQSGLPRARFYFDGAGEVEIELVNVIQGGLCLITVDDNPLTTRIVETELADIPDLMTIGGILGVIVDGLFTVTSVTEIEVLTPGLHHIDITFLPKLDEESLLGFGGGIRRVSFCGPDIQATCEGGFMSEECCNAIVESINAQTEALNSLASVVSAGMTSISLNLAQIRSSMCPCDAETGTPIMPPPEQEESVRCRVADGVARHIIEQAKRPLQYLIDNWPSTLVLEFYEQFPYVPINGYYPIFEMYSRLIDVTFPTVNAQALIDQLSHSSWVDEKVCQLYCALPSTGDFDIAVRQEFWNSITNELLDVNLYFANWVINAPVSYLQAKAQQFATIPSEFDCGDCICALNIVCENEFNFLTARYGWEQQPETVGGVTYPRGEWLQGIGWTFTTRGTQNRIVIAIDHEQATVNTVKITFQYNRFGTNALTRNVTRIGIDGVNYVDAFGSVTDLGDNRWEVEVEVAEDADTERMQILLQFSSGSPETAVLILEKVEVNCNVG